MYMIAGRDREVGGRLGFVRLALELDCHLSFCFAVKERDRQAEIRESDFVLCTCLGMVRQLTAAYYCTGEQSCRAVSAECTACVVGKTPSIFYVPWGVVQGSLTFLSRRDDGYRRVSGDFGAGSGETANVLAVLSAHPYSQAEYRAA